MAAPLNAIDGGSLASIDGQTVLDAIAEVLERLLPRVPLDDPTRPALVALACASGARALTAVGEDA